MIIDRLQNLRDSGISINDKQPYEVDTVRRFVLLIALSVLFISCSADKNAPVLTVGQELANPDQTLSLALFRGGFGEEYWKTVISAFLEQYPDADINYKIHPSIGELIRPALISGEYPDFLYCSDSNADGVVAGLIENRALTDLTDVFDGNAYRSEETLRSLFLPGILDNPRYSPYNDGRIYLAPLSYGPLGLVYNRTLFEKNGWDIPLTWDEFFELGDKAKARGIALITYPGLYPGYLESLIFPAIANGAGMSELNRLFMLDDEVFDNPDVLASLNAVKRICDDGYLLNGSFEMNHLQSQAAVLLDKALFIPNGIWIQNEMHNYPRTEGFAFGLAAVPVFSGEIAPCVQISYEQMTIPEGAKNPEFAKEFLRFLYSDESVKIFAERANGVFPLTNALDIGKPYMDAAVYNMYSILEDGSVTAYMPAFVNAPSSGAVTARDRILMTFAGQVLQNGQTVEAWAENMKRR